MSRSISRTITGGHYTAQCPASELRTRGTRPGDRPRRISYRFYVGNDGYYWWWTACTKDTEAIDGLGLPGSHSCGVQRVSSTVSYLG
jgi:hypothetical protein